MSRSAVLADLAERAPAEAIVGLKELIERAQLDGEVDTAATALVELGRARRALGHVDLAEQSLVSALHIAPASSATAADAHLVLAGVMSLSGRNDDAFQHLDVARRASDTVIRRSAELQRAVLLQRTGRLAAALEIYDQQLPSLRDKDLTSDVARVLQNRGEVHARLGKRDQALSDYHEAASLFGALGQPLRQAQTLQNVGWVHGVWGELTAALAQFDDVSERLRTSSHDAGAVDISRAEALLTAGLDREALDAASRAIEPLIRVGCHVEAARGLLLAAQAARDIDPSAAREHGEAAAVMFAEHGASSWCLRATFEARRHDDEIDLESLEQLIADLAAHGLHGSVVSARTVASVRAIEIGELAVARHHVTEARAGIDENTSVDLRLAVHLAAASLADAESDPAGVLAVVAQSFRDIAQLLTTYGDVEVKSAFRRQIQSLQRLAVKACVALDDPAAAVEFGERSRRIELHTPPRSIHDSSATARRTLRALTTQLREAEANHVELDESVERRDEIRRNLASHRDDRDEPFDQTRLRSRNNIVSLLDDGSRLSAVRWTSSGEQLVDLGDRAGIHDAAASAQSLLAGAARTRSDVSHTLWRHLDVIDERLAPVLRAMADSGDAIRLSGPGWLTSVPWRLLPSIRHQPVAIVPSMQWLSDSASTDMPSRTGPAVVVAGPRLTNADAEASAVAAVYPDAVVLTGDRATPAAVLAALPGAHSLHVVAHGRLDRGNPEWSSIELAGGSLTVHEIRHAKRTPATVVLSACHTAPSRGDDLLGFAGALFASGTHTVIASSGPLPDTERTVSKMATLHTNLAAGLPPSVALAGAFEATSNVDDTVSDGLLVCLGAR